MAFNVTVNGSQSGVANLLALINTSNATTITNAQVAFAAPVILTGGEIDIAGRNTTVLVTSVPNQGFIDEGFFDDGIPVKYRRTAVTEGVSSTVGDFTITGATTWDQLKTSVASANNMVQADILIGLQATEPGSALIYDTYPPAGGGEGNTQAATVVAVNDSYVYHQLAGMAITLNYAATDTPLHNVITVTDLDGFIAVV